MFFKSSTQAQVSNAANCPIDSLIGTGAQIHGDVTFSGGIRIDGVIRGNVRIEAGKTGLLMLGETGRIIGEVHVSNVVINGEVEGTVYASELIEVGSTGKVHGDLHYTFLEVHPGAEMQGKLRKMPVQLKQVVTEAAAPSAELLMAEAA